LKTAPQKQGNPLKFRNFVHRRLLEFHFSLYPASTDEIELVFDRFDMSKEQISNLDNYLRNNWNLPKFRYITHADSIYCEALQLTGQLVNAVNDYKLGRAEPKLAGALRCLPIKEIR